MIVSAHEQPTLSSGAVHQLSAAALHKDERWFSLPRHSSGAWTVANPKIVFRISLPEQLDPDAFETFMTGRFFPAVDLRPTRIGLVTGLNLWRRAANSEQPSRVFLMEYGFDGVLSDRLPRVDDAAVLAEFEAYRPYFEPLGPFTERTPEPDVPRSEGGAAAGRGSAATPPSV
jgi:hypothetical protein